MADRRAVWLVPALAAALAAPGAASADPIILPSPIAIVLPPPPLIAGATPLESEQELRFPGHLATVERVEVGLRDDGSAGRIVATQRILIEGVGDYSFVVPAPVENVAPGPGTQSDPGQRNTGIVWQGFSPGKRVLAARATLEPLAAERGLPLSVRIQRHGDATTVRFLNVARRQFQVTLGSASAASLRPVLAFLRKALATSGVLTRTLQAEGTPRGAGTIVVDLPLRLSGTISVAGAAPVRIAEVLGQGRPLERTITVRGKQAPRVSLRVELPPPAELLPTDDQLAAARDPLRLVETAVSRVALRNQYAQYLASPDQLGARRTSYLYRTVALPERVPPPLRGAGTGGSDTLAIVLASVLGAAALAGLAVLWAHS